MFSFGIIVLVLAIILGITAFYLTHHNFKKWAYVMTASCIILLISGGALTYIGAQSESFKRFTKDVQSNYSGGLNRIITVVNNEGKVIKEYRGKMDIQENDGSKVVFVMAGNKYIIYNSIFNTIFVEETGE